VSFTWNFTDYLTWQMPAGAGAPAQQAGAGGNVFYTLATRTWSVVFLATNPGNAWASTIGAASGVFTPGDFVLNVGNNLPNQGNPSASNVNGTIANSSYHIT
jgi:hypothetical protein